MFTLQRLLHLLEKENRGWKNPTTMTKTILMALTDYNYPSDVASKVFSGINQGRNVFFEIEQLISDDSFETYITNVELRLRNQNFRNGHFDSQKMVEATHQLLKESVNLNQDMYQGLFQSYVKNKDNRPYLFLAECFYYALACRHDKTASYKTAIFSEAKNPQFLPSWSNELEKVLFGKNLPPKFWTTIQQITDKEIAVFKTLATLIIVDEDEEYYLYAPVTDEEIQLYKNFGISNTEFLLMEEFGLVNLGARIDNLVSVKEELAGFQNNNLVFAFKTDEDPFDIAYKSYRFTTVGTRLLEILEIETNDKFFEQLAKLFTHQYANQPIVFYLVPVEAMEEAENMEELERYRLM